MVFVSRQISRHLAVLWELRPGLKMIESFPVCWQFYLGASSIWQNSMYCSFKTQKAILLCKCPDQLMWPAWGKYLRKIFEWQLLLALHAVRRHERYKALVQNSRPRELHETPHLYFSATILFTLYYLADRWMMGSTYKGDIKEFWYAHFELNQLMLSNYVVDISLNGFL